MAFRAAIFCLLLVRIIWLFYTDIPLFADEAQYWFWSLSPDWGYYSKPPMLSWVIFLTTSVLGDSEFAIRISSTILHFFTSYIIYLIALSLKPLAIKEAKYAALAYFTMPAVFLSSMIISTDPLLLFFWALTLLFFIKAQKSDTMQNWLGVGVFLGMGMLSKYNMAIFIISAGLFYIIKNRSICFLQNKKIWLASLIALLIFSPNIWWNFHNHFVSFQHTAELASQQHSLLNRLMKVLEFGLAQFAVMGPILFVLAILSLRNMKSHMLLSCFTWPFLLIIMLVAFKSKAYANWAAPTYIAGVILAVFTAFKMQRVKWIQYSIVFHCIIGLGIMSYQPIMQHFALPLNAKTDVFFRMRGAKELATEVLKLHQLYPNATIAVAERKPLALLHYYTRMHQLKLIKWNPDGRITDHFALIAEPISYKELLVLTPNSEPISLNNFYTISLNNIEIKIYDKVVFLQNIWLMNPL